MTVILPAAPFKCDKEWLQVTKKWLQVTKKWLQVTKKWLQVTKKWLQVTKKWLQVTKKWLQVTKRCTSKHRNKDPSTLATLFSHMWPRFVAGIFIPVGKHYFQALASTLQFVAQVCDRLWLVPATDRAFAYITYMSPPHVALVCSGPPQCAATCG